MTTPRRRRAARPWIVAAAVARLAATGAASALRAKQAEKAVQFAMLPPSGSAFVSMSIFASMAVSPNGDQIVYSAAGVNHRQLWVRPIGSTVSKVIEGSEGA